MEAVTEVLVSLRLERYARTFEELGWDDVEHIRELDQESLQQLANDVGMKPGHASKFVKHFCSREASEIGDPLASALSQATSSSKYATAAAFTGYQALPLLHSVGPAQQDLAATHRSAASTIREQDPVGSHMSSGSTGDLAHQDPMNSHKSAGSAQQDAFTLQDALGHHHHAPMGRVSEFVDEGAFFSDGSVARTEGSVAYVNRSAQKSAMGSQSRSRSGGRSDKFEHHLEPPGRARNLDGGDFAEHARGSASSLSALLPNGTGEALEQGASHLSNWFQSQLGARWGEATSETEGFQQLPVPEAQEHAAGSGRSLPIVDPHGVVGGHKQHRGLGEEESSSRRPYLMGCVSHDRATFSRRSSEGDPRGAPGGAPEPGRPEEPEASQDRRPPTTAYEWAGPFDRGGELRGGAPGARGDEFQSYWYMALTPADGCCGDQDGAQRPGAGAVGFAPELTPRHWRLLAGILLGALLLLGSYFAALRGAAGQPGAAPAAEEPGCCSGVRARCLACQAGISVASYCNTLSDSDADKAPLGCDDICNESAESVVAHAHEVEAVFSREDCCDACSTDADCISWHFGQVPHSSYKEKYFNGHFPRCWARRRNATGGTATPSGRRQSNAAHGAPTLFCLSLLLPCGSSAGLLGMQADLSYSIFACDASAVYSDTAVDLGRGMKADVFSLDLGCPEEDEPVATSIYKELWTHIVAEGRYQRFDWTIKVDPGTVFFPERLRLALPKAGTGSFLSSCQQELKGPLEILSSKAVTMLSKGQRSCSTLAEESAFLQSCLLEVGASQISRGGGDLLASEACGSTGWAECQSPNVAFASFTNEEDYKACVAEAAKAEGGRRLSKSPGPRPL